MSVEQQLTALRLRNAVLNLDLQLYKGSIFKQRWGTPGGIDRALPCYDEALRTLAETFWPPELAADAGDLTRRVEQYRATLQAKDVTIANAQHTRMIETLEDLRDGVRVWPEPRPATRRGSGGTRDQAVRLAMDEVVASES